MAFNPNMSNKEVANLIFLNYKDKTPYLNCDYANVTTTGLEATREFAKGGQGAPNRIAFDGQKTGTLTIQTQITTMQLFAMLAGSDIENTFKYVKRIVCPATSGTTIKIPDGITFVSGSVYVYAANDDCGTPLEVTVADNTITLTTAGNANAEYIVYGTVEVKDGAQTVKFTSKNFPKAFTVYGETPWKTEDDEIVAMHLAYYKAVPQAKMELAFNNTAIIEMSITCDLLADDKENIYDMSVIK